MLAHYASAFQSAMFVTIALTVFSIIGGTVLGVAVGVMSSLTSPARYLARVHIELFLGLPVLVIMIWFYYVLPAIDQRLAFDPFWTAVLALSLSASGFIAEIIDGGFKSIPAGQLDAALMLGLTRYQAVRHIILPQVVGVMWPALIVQYITTYKLVPLASIIGVNEILHVGGAIIQETYQPLEVYTAIAVLYLVTVYPLNILARKLHRRINNRGLLSRI